MTALRTMVTVLVGGGLVLGCQKSPTPVDNSALVVQPGLGISNLCEVGMTLSQIRRANGEATTHGIYDESLSLRRLESWGRGRFVLVPSLAAIAPIGKSQPLHLVEFYVQPYRAPMIPGLEIREPFRGKLAGALSFKDRAVGKQEIESAFGSVNQVATNAAEALEFRKMGSRFTHRLSDAVEELWYPDKGVAFVLRSNVVASFQVFRVIGTNR